MINNNIIFLGSLYEEHSRWGVHSVDGICPTCPAAMGMGGGYVPMVLINDKDKTSNK